MSSFERIKIKDIVTFKTGKLDSNAAENDGKYPFFTCAQQTLRINKHAFDTECVLLAGNNAAGIFPLKYYKGKFNAYQRTYIIEPIDINKLYIRYVYYALRPFLKQFEQSATGVTTKFLTLGIMNNLYIPLPSPSIQKKIAAVLSAYDDLIENNNRRIAILEKMAEEIYREWFVRMRFPGHEKVKFHKGVPEGWELTKIEKLCDEKRIGIKLKNVEYNTKYIGLEHLPRKSISIKDSDTVESIQSDKLLFKDRDILFCKIRPYLHKVALAHFAGACSTDTIIIRPKKVEYEGLILFTVFSTTFIELATASAKGTKMPRADWDFLKKLEILLPSNNILATFQTQFDSYFALICNYLNGNERLKQSRNLLLSRLLSGKLSVENLGIKFPPGMEETDA